MKCKLAAWTITMALLGSMAPAAKSEQPSPADLERQFQTLPQNARRLTGPLFWLHGDESRERLEMYVEKVAQGGNGSFTAESRPHKDWLGEGWYRDLAICLEAAKKHDLQMWIFDEKWWPSQGVGGKVPPRWTAKRLNATAVEVEGPREFTADGYAGERYVAALAGRVAPDGKIDGESLVDLAKNVQNGKLTWNAPAGKWRVMTFTHIQAPALGQNGQMSVDGASRDCVDWFLKTVYQPHYDRFGADFGKTIPGFFYDEPETRGDWGTELNATLAEWGVDWKKAYVAYKFGLSGEEQTAAKFQYLDALAETWGRTMYGGMSRWCQAHGVQSMGHFMEHGYLYLNPGYCAGDMMRLQKYSDMGGIDLVCQQMYPGQRPHHIYQTPKLGSSISHVFGKPDDVTMCEMFGAYGQNITYSQMKWLTDQMQVRGVNFMIPHSFNPRSPHDGDCPPYFYNGGFEPRWPLYRVYADYTSRLTLMLVGGRHVCPVALLFAGNLKQVGKMVSPEDMTSALQDAQYDCDWLPMEVFEGKASLEGKEIKLHQERYRVLIVPPTETIPYGTLAKVKEFYDRGGIVVGYGFLPSKSATLGKSSKDIAALRNAVWGDSADGAKPGAKACKTNAAGGRAYFMAEKPAAKEITAAWAGDAGVHPTLEVLEGETGGWLHVLHRVKDGRDVFFVANQNHQGAARLFKFRATAAGSPECWDAMRNEITAIPFQRTGDKQVEFTLTLEPSEAVLLVFQPKKIERPLRIDAGAKPVRASIPLVRKPNPVSVPDNPGTPTELLAKDPLDGSKWIWHSEGDAAKNAPPGTCYFRQSFVIPAGQKVKKAEFTLTADNDFTLYVNGRKVVQSDGTTDNWRQRKHVNIAASLREGKNVLAIAATNGGEKPNPAGLIGRYTIQCWQGPRLTGTTDTTWKTADRLTADWNAVDFDDSAWRPAKAVANFGAGVWGNLNARTGMTLGPVKADDPFLASFAIPTDVDLSKVRVFLEMDDLPDDSAAVTINRKHAGGAIGKPSRLDITGRVKVGENTVVIEPLAPKAARIVFYE